MSAFSRLKGKPHKSLSSQLPPAACRLLALLPPRQDTTGLLRTGGRFVSQQTYIKRINKDSRVVGSASSKPNQDPLSRASHHEPMHTHSFHQGDRQELTAFRSEEPTERTLLFDPSPRSKQKCEAAPVKCASIMGSVSMLQSGLDLCVWS